LRDYSFNVVALHEDTPAIERADRQEIPMKPDVIERV